MSPLMPVLRGQIIRADRPDSCNAPRWKSAPLNRNDVLSVLQAERDGLHSEFGVKLLVLLGSVARDLPPLVPSLQRILREAVE